MKDGKHAGVLVPALTRFAEACQLANRTLIDADVITQLKVERSTRAADGAKFIIYSFRELLTFLYTD